MRWTLEVGLDPEAIDHIVEDRFGNELEAVRAVKKIPLIGVIVERFVKRDGILVIDGDELLKRREFVFLGRIRRWRDFHAVGD